MIFIIQNHALENDAKQGYFEHFEGCDGAPRASNVLFVVHEVE